MSERELHFNMSLELSEAQREYFDASARIRRISRRRLIERVLKVICDDHLFLAILDDDSIQPQRCDGESTSSHYYPFRTES